MAEQKKNIQLPLWAQIVVGVIVAIIIISIALNMPKEKDLGMNIQEAQAKCMLMEEADLVNIMGEPFGPETTKKAEKTCLAGWDRSTNPDNTDEKFIEIISSDWESRKDEVLAGHTLQQLYDEAN